MSICGIDEAGRGCIAGNLAVAGVILHNEIKELNDSKKLSAKKREELYEVITQKADYHIVSIDSVRVDEIGLSLCIKNAIIEIKEKLKADKYIMDGNTNFGVNGVEFLIKADAKVAEVSASSILAKVSRDREILKSAKLYPEYQFEKHKGYGTKLHIQKIKEFGYSPIHRKSFKLKSLNQKSLF